MRFATVQLEAKHAIGSIVSAEAYESCFKENCLKHFQQNQRVHFV